MKKIKNTDIILNGVVYRKVDDGYGVYTYTEGLDHIQAVDENGDPFQYTPFEGKLK